MKDVLCLSRAPLNYKAGIPVFCKNLYCNLELLYDIANYAIQFSPRESSRHSLNHGSEYTFASLFCFKTLSFSPQFLCFVLLSAHKYKALHYQHPDPLSAIAVILAKIINPRLKILITWHADIYKSYLPFAMPLLVIDYILFCLSSVIIFPTKAHFKTSLYKYLPLIACEKKIIPLGLSLPIRDHFISRELIEPVNLIAIGRLVDYKGFDYLIDSLSLLQFQYTLNIIGDGPNLSDLKNLIEYYGINDLVSIHTSLSDSQKHEMLNLSHIFVLPSISQSEAYGIVQLEAMYHGLPIINTQLNNGVNEVAPDQACALTAIPKSHEDLASKINKLYTDLCLYKTLSINSYNRFSLFTADKMAQSYLSVFSGLIDA